MTRQLGDSDPQNGSTSNKSVTSSTATPSRLMMGIYRDIGLAAVAMGLEVRIEELEAEVVEAVKRGSRYIHLMPRAERAASA
jgi:hypothetical protein